MEWDKILTGEFKKRLQLKEIEYSLLGKMVKGRQITWNVFHNFRTTDIDGAMLEWDEIINIELHGDNLSQFLTDWDATCLNINQLPDENFLETMFRKQIEKSTQLRGQMALYWQEVTQKGVKKSYEGLRRIVDLYLEELHLKRNQAALATKSNAWKGAPGAKGAGKGKGKGKGKAKGGNKTGTCRQWGKEGKCSRGKDCPWLWSHTPENAGSGRGKSQRQPSPRPSHDSRSDYIDGRRPSRERGRSPGRKGKGKGDQVYPLQVNPTKLLVTSF